MRPKTLAIPSPIEMTVPNSLRSLTWVMLETLDWRIVTASPMDGFLLATAEALKALAERLRRF
jgi:hypothetical protein